MTTSDNQKFLNEIVEKLHILNWVNKNTTFKDLAEPLDKIFNDPGITNLFLNDLNLSKILFNYITSTKLDFYYEIFDYLVNKFKDDDDDIIKMFNVFKFNNGLFTDMKIKEITELNDETQNKLLNTILILNNQPTQNKKFNNIFDNIKYIDLNDFKFNDIFNGVLFNNIQNNYNFKFMSRYEKFMKDLKEYSVKDLNNKLNVKFEHLDIMDNYILKYNDNSKVFKMWFYMLLSYISNKKFSFKELLNIFLNANLIFYNKLINLNDYSSNLITFIYFKDNDKYVPNLRYTIDIKGDKHEDKIKYLIDINKKPINKYEEFKTTIESDDKGIYFKTCEFKKDDIIKHCEDLIKDNKINELIYYIFNSQFLNRSTCLFGYYIYYYYTHRILKNNYYFDIIALTQPFEDFNVLINENDNSIKFDDFENIEHLTINDFIKFIK